MPSTRLTDHEVAAVIDSLANLSSVAEVDSALAKINGLMTPRTYGLTVSDGPFACFEDRDIVILVSALSDDAEHWTQPADQLRCRQLATQADAELQRRPALVAEIAEHE